MLKDSVVISGFYPLLGLCKCRVEWFRKSPCWVNFYVTIDEEKSGYELFYTFDNNSCYCKPLLYILWSIVCLVKLLAAVIIQYVYNS